MSQKKPLWRGLKEVVVLLSAGVFLIAINKNWALSAGRSSVVLVVFLAAIGLGHDGFLETISGPHSMA